MQNTIEKHRGESLEFAATSTLSDAIKIGEIFARSGFFSDTREAAQCVTKILCGRELGFEPFQSMNGIYIVKGKISIGANLMAARVKASEKYDFRVQEMTDTNCAIEFFERGQSIGISPFSIQEARKAGTQNTDKFPRNMLFARAMSNGIRWYCPDVFMTPMYTPDELGAAVDEEGAPIAAQSAPAMIQAEAVAAPINKSQGQTIKGLAELFYGDGYSEQLKGFLTEGYAKKLSELTFAEAEAVKESFTDALAKQAAPREEPEAVEGEVADEKAAEYFEDPEIQHAEFDPPTP